MSDLRRWLAVLWWSALWLAAAWFLIGDLRMIAGEGDRGDGRWSAYFGHVATAVPEKIDAEGEDEDARVIGGDEQGLGHW